MEIDRLAFLCCKGGWPEVCIGRKMSDRAALMVARSYVDAVCSSEMDTDDGVVRDSDRMRMFLRSYARTIGGGSSPYLI